MFFSKIVLYFYGKQKTAMKKTITLFFLLFCKVCFAQINLVPNPSFEDTSSCPISAFEINFLGCNAGSTKPDVNNAIALGANTKVNCNNCTVIGGEKIGICTTEPQATLDVNGTIQAKQFMILENGYAKNLLDMISELQNEVAELKQQITASVKN